MWTIDKNFERLFNALLSSWTIEGMEPGSMTTPVCLINFVLQAENELNMADCTWGNVITKHDTSKAAEAEYFPCFCPSGMVTSKK